MHTRRRTKKSGVCAREDIATFLAFSSSDGFHKLVKTVLVVAVLGWLRGAEIAMMTFEMLPNFKRETMTEIDVCFNEAQRRRQSLRKLITSLFPTLLRRSTVSMTVNLAAALLLRTPHSLLMTAAAS
jgi:hypothetical protein